MPVLSFVSSMIQPEDDPRAAVNWAIENGFHGIELSGFYHWPDLVDDETLDWLRGRASGHGITYTIHFPLKAAPAAHHTERWLGWLARMKQTIALAERLRCPVIVVHPGPIDCPGADAERATEALRKDAVDNLMRFIGEVEPLARAAGTVLCFENLHHRAGDITRSYEHLAAIIDAAASPAIKIALDVGHAHIHDGLPEAVEAFGDRIHHLHLDDARDGVDHLEIGTGEINMEQYASLMAPGRVGVATMEVLDESDYAGCQLRSREALKARFGDWIT